MQRHVVASAMLLLALQAPHLVAQSAAELVARNIDARGGLDRLRAVQSLRVTGRILIGGIDAPFVKLAKRPGFLRLDVALDAKSIVQAYDGTRAWWIMPLLGHRDPAEMPAEIARELRHQADIDGALVDYGAKGNTVELVGKEELDKAPAYRLRLTFADGDARQLWLDADSLLEVKMTSTVRRQGVEMEVATSFGDYRNAEGLKLPFAIESRAKGQLLGRTIVERVETNVSLDDALFRMPSAAQ